MMKKASKHKRCDECGFWYKADKVAGGLCLKCNNKFLSDAEKEADEVVGKFWNEAPGTGIAPTADYLAAITETAEWAGKELKKKKSPGWTKVAQAFAAKVKAQQAMEEAHPLLTVEMPSDSDPLLTVHPAAVKLVEALGGAYTGPPGQSAYNCTTCGKALTWQEIKVSQKVCAACGEQYWGEGEHTVTIKPGPIVEVSGPVPTPTPDVPPLLAKSQYAKEKKAWIAELATLAAMKYGEGASEVSIVETSVPVGTATIVHEPLKGHLEMGEPVVAFTPAPATETPTLPDVPFKPFKPFKSLKVKPPLKGKFKDLTTADLKKLSGYPLAVEHETLPQKVKGMAVLAAAFPHSKTLETIHFRTPQEIANSKSGQWMGTQQLFLRPAPSVPQHGFIDSRPCVGVFAHERKAEAQALLKEVLERDPGGALIVCRYIDSRRNAVVTPIGITFGEGHDGATAGKGTWSVPLVKGTAPLGAVERTIAGIPEDAMPFVEVVFPYLLESGVASDSQDYAFPVVVQLRAGPAVESEVDFVPKDMVVTKVYEIEGDGTESLDGWPAKVKAMGAEHGGLAVYHAGGSLLSHYGANAALAGVAYLTSHRPVPGEQLRVKQPPVWPDKAAFLLGFVRGLKEKIESNQARSDAVAFLLVVGHSVVRMQEGKFGYYLGVACAFMCRLGMAASIGERRHSKRAKQDGEHKSRDQLFHEVLSAHLNTVKAKETAVGKYVEFRKRMVAAHGAFKNEHWPGGYGGKAWAACALATIGLDAAVMDVVQGEGEMPFDGLAEVGIALHNAINQAHNNGWWLNKFAYHTMCDEAAQGRLNVVIQALRWFDVIGEVRPEEFTLPYTDLEALVEGQVLVVSGPTRALAIREAQMRLDWNDDPLVVHVQYRVQGKKGAQYERQDVAVTPDQSATLHLHCAGMAKGKSWGSQTMEYYPLEVYPGSNVVGVTLGGSVFFPLTALKGV